jgi:hypothetical protein
VNTWQNRLSSAAVDMNMGLQPFIMASLTEWAFGVDPDEALNYLSSVTSTDQDGLIAAAVRMFIHLKHGNVEMMGMFVDIENYMGKDPTVFVFYNS